MPSTSKKQHNLMAAVAHNPAFAKRVGISQKVGKEFAEADKGKKFASGGVSRSKEQGINKSSTHHGAAALFKEGGSMATKKMSMKETMGPRSMSSDVEKGSNKKSAHGEHAIQKRGKTKAMMPKMAKSDTGMKRGGKVRK